MTYKEANEKLVGRNKESKKIDNNTYLQRRGEDIAVKLHKTDIITFKADGDIVLNTEGWITVTTKDRLNKFLPTGYFISQNNKIWYLNKDNSLKGFETFAYADGITIHNKNENFTGISGEGENPKIKIELNKKILKYTGRFIKALLAGKVPAPSGGDCWGCCMKDKDGKTAFGTDHLRDHIRESYFVPSLLVNAIEAFPVSIAAKSFVGSLWNGGTVDKSHWGAGICERQIGQAIKRYLQRQFGLAA